jgi:hypothetical protein
MIVPSLPELLDDACENHRQLMKPQLQIQLRSPVQSMAEIQLELVPQQQQQQQQQLPLDERLTS